MSAQVFGLPSSTGLFELPSKVMTTVILFYLYIYPLYKLYIYPRYFPVIAPPSANSERKPKTFGVSSRNHRKRFFW